MSRERIIGRKEEYNKLMKAYESDKSEFVVLYGRRRVGKTFLINQTFEGKISFKFTGSYGENKATQIKRFLRELSICSGEKYSGTSDWNEALLCLRQYIESFDKNNRVLLFFDELSWIDGKKSGFLSAFEYFYNNYCASKDNVMLIVCGSSTSWFTKKIFKNKGGLFDRLTSRIYLNQFNLKETEEFLKHKGIEWTQYDMCQVYMIMGGVPYYLNALDQSLSFNQNIDNLFFKKHGELYDEFNFLYNTIFENSNCTKIVEALSSKRSGLTMKEISQITGISANGLLSQMLNDLVDSDFVSINEFYGKSKKDRLYQLSDFYSLFYFSFLYKKNTDEHYFENSIDNPQRKIWFGFTFELMAKKHIAEIKNKLGISGILSNESIFYTKCEEKNVQIDLLIERRDNVINLVEMKFAIEKFEIDKDYYDNLITKIAVLKKYIPPRYSVQPVFLTTFGVKKNKYSNIVVKEITIGDFF